MVKNTVRFHESVVDEIEGLVESGVLESKSEFYRFASEYVLEQIKEDYEPHMMDFGTVKDELMPPDPRMIEPEATPGDPNAGIPFFESFAMVRKYALRGNLHDAEDFIDHHYDPNDRDALLLEELLQFYRNETDGRSTRHSPE